MEPDRFGDEESLSVVEQIKLEQAKAARANAEKERIEAEAKAKKSEARAETAKAVGKKASGCSFKTILILLAAGIFVFAFLIPMLTPSKPNVVVTTSDLQKVVNINSLSTVEHVYHGIAEKKGFLSDIFNNVDFRVKYEAHVRASFDMSDIKFKIDEDNKKIYAYLPEPTIGEPALNEKELGVLPERALGNLREILDICKEDAAKEIAANTQIRDKSLENLGATVRGLISPLVGTSYEIICIPASEGGAANESA